MRIVDDFERKTVSNPKKEQIDLPCGRSVFMYSINTIHDLNQFIGYGKYINCKEAKVFLRGQTDLYNGTLIPSLYRKKTNPVIATHKFYENLNRILKTKQSFKNFPKQIFEATIQHYGIKTTQIDVVDNVWIALWFAVNQFDSKIINTNEHIYVSRSTNKYGYVYLLASDACDLSNDIRGLYKGKETQITDLRQALPSYYLRPHAQHAYMLRKNDFCVTDYTDLIVGIAKVQISDALYWIGDSELLSVSTLFPSAYFDNGYEVLLKNYPKYDSSYVKYQGSIQIITD